MRPSVLLLVALALLAVGIWLSSSWFGDPELGPGAENVETARPDDQPQQQQAAPGTAQDSSHPGLASSASPPGWR